MTIKDLQKVVNYLWRDEYNHWEEDNNPEDHIFHPINNIKNWIEGCNITTAEEEEVVDEYLNKSTIAPESEEPMSDFAKRLIEIARPKNL